MIVAAGEAARSEAACAGRETRDLVRREESRLGPAGLCGARLVLREPEARMARGSLAAAVRAFREAGAEARIVPAGVYRGAPRPTELYGAAWELDAIAAAQDESACDAGPETDPPAWLEPSGGSFRSTRVLELGCASGALGAALEAAGARVTGVEPDPEAARRASSRLSRVIEAPVETAWDEIGSGWDAVVAADVLEHVEEPVEVLRELSARTAAAGVLVAALPNVVHASVLAGALQGRWDRTLEGVVAYGHRTYAGRAGWRRILAAGGWRAERWEPLRLLSATAAPWRAALAAAGLDAEDLGAYQWIVVAAKAPPRGDLHLGPSDALGPAVEDPAGFVAERLAGGAPSVTLPNALSPEAMDALLRGDVACGQARRSLASGFAAAALAERVRGADPRLTVTPCNPAAPPDLLRRVVDEARRRGLAAAEPSVFLSLRVERA